MPEAIGASSSQFSIAVSIFYATYVTFETPSALLLKKLTPRYVITGLCVIWSLATIFSGFIQNVASLYATRLILGACEAGLFPSLNLYLTMVYQRDEQAKRVSYLFVCAALSGAFGGLLAYVILFMDGLGGFAGWRLVKSFFFQWVVADILLQMDLYHRGSVQCGLRRSCVLRTPKRSRKCLLFE